MTIRKTIAFVLMDPPFESERIATAMRLMSAVVKQGHHLQVFAYEGAVFLPFALQKGHANAIHGRNEIEEQHPLTRDWVAALQAEAHAQGSSVEWVNCGLCVDERGAHEAIAGIKRGSPADLAQWLASADNVISIATR